ncbi:MAG TPA: pyridoxal-phosphate dependent enzyme [Nocardioidaceae bacterium]|jgi:threonine dehydratase
MTPKVPSSADVEAAAFRLGSSIRRTPVLELDLREHGVESHVHLKLELTQHTGSFKARGALNSVLSLPKDVTGVCAASGGNHAAAVSWAARRAGLVADVFVPAEATPAKLDRIRSYGGRIHAVDGHVKEALEACRAYSEEAGVPLLHPYDTFETVSGAGTTGLEIEEQVPDVDLVLVGCGGGGLYSGLAISLEGIARVQPVEPELCPDLACALAERGPVPVAVGGLAADSLGAPYIGDIAYAVASKHAVEPVLIPEASILAARMLLWESTRVLAEPGACVALGSVLTGAVRVDPGQPVVVVVSGGNNETFPTVP